MFRPTQKDEGVDANVAGKPQARLQQNGTTSLNGVLPVKRGRGRPPKVPKAGHPPATQKLQVKRGRPSKAPPQRSTGQGNRPTSLFALSVSDTLIAGSCRDLGQRSGILLYEHGLLSCNAGKKKPPAEQQNGQSTVFKVRSWWLWASTHVRRVHGAGCRSS